MTRIFETERLYCEAFTNADLDLLFDLHNAEEIAITTADGKQSKEDTLKHLKNFINNQNEKGYSQWKFYEKSTNKFVGRGGLDYKQFTEKYPLRPELRAALLKEFWGKGYASEIAYNSIKYGFEVINLDMIVGTGYINNLASMKIMKNLGFVQKEIIIYKDKECPYFELNRLDYIKKQKSDKIASPATS